MAAVTGGWPNCWPPRSVHMTASSSCSGTVDNFWSRDDIRVHTFGGSPKAVKSSLRDLSRACRPAPQARSVEERKRRGSPPLRTISSRRKTALAARRHGADQDAKTRTTWNAIAPRKPSPRTTSGVHRRTLTASTRRRCVICRRLAVHLMPDW